MSTSPELPRAPRRPARQERRASWRVRLPTLDWYLDKLRQVEDAIERVMDQPKFNAAGLASLITRAEAARATIDRLLAEHPDELAGMTADQLAAWAGNAMATWPDQVLERAFAVYGERHHGRFIFITDSGHRAEFDPEGGAWAEAT